jgi:hypothetical protein
MMLFVYLYVALLTKTGEQRVRRYARIARHMVGKKFPPRCYYFLFLSSSVVGTGISA